MTDLQVIQAGVLLVAFAPILLVLLVGSLWWTFRPPVTPTPARTPARSIYRPFKGHRGT